MGQDLPIDPTGPVPQSTRTNFGAVALLRHLASACCHSAPHFDQRRDTSGRPGGAPIPPHRRFSRDVRRDPQVCMSWCAHRALRTASASLETREHLTEGFTRIPRRRRGRLAREEARCAAAETPRPAPGICGFGRTRALRRHVTHRAAAVGTRHMTARERKPSHHVEGSTIRPSSVGQVCLETRLPAPPMRRVTDTTPPGAQRRKPRQPMAPAIVPKLLVRIDAPPCPARCHGQDCTVRSARGTTPLPSRRGSVHLREQ